MSYNRGDIVIILQGEGSDLVKTIAVVDGQGDYYCLDSYRDSKFTGTTIAANDSLFRNCRILPMYNADISSKQNYA